MACPVSDSSLGMCEWTGCPGAGATVPSSSFHATETARVYTRTGAHPRPGTAPELRPGAGPGSVQLHLRNELTRDELDDLDLFYDF